MDKNDSVRSFTDRHYSALVIDCGFYDLIALGCIPQKYLIIENCMMLQLFPKPFLISFCFLVCVVLLRYDISDSDEISAPTECLAV